MENNSDTGKRHPFKVVAGEYIQQNKAVLKFIAGVLLVLLCIVCRRWL